MPRICIVTPDLAGPMRNGGIGAHCLWLARFLAREASHEVTVLFTASFHAGGSARFRREFRAQGIEFLCLEDLPREKQFQAGAQEFSTVSKRVFHFLREAAFDVAHFQDYQAHGYASIQAKRTGLALEGTALTVTMHSPSAWAREGMGTWRHPPLRDAMLDYAERYCCEHAGLLISPSRYMFRWAQERGWRLAANRRVIPNLIEAGPRAADRTDFSHLAFFGRLETRKGLELFCAALERLTAQDPGHGLRKVTFLGKPGWGAGGGPAVLDFVRNATEPWSARGVSVSLETGLDSGRAIGFLRETGAVAVMPSLQDNYPYAVLECLENGIPFLASSVGGIPELVSGEALFEPGVGELAAALRMRESRAGRARSLYSAREAREGWLAASRKTSSVPAAARQRPKVSVCVAHYNYGRYLPQLLASLARSDYPDFEVIVADDGSTEPASLESFERQRALHESRGWRFLRKGNEGIGATRNFAAREARGEHLIFMDADNLATPGMISAFVRGMEASGADCLTCHMHAFKGEEPPAPGARPEYSYTPLGPCLEAGLLENVFGDANFCVRRETFSALGGFTTDRELSYEDWEFLARLSLAGHWQDVIPEALFHYRWMEGGFSRVTDQAANRRRVLRAYLASGKLDPARLCEDLVVPLHQYSAVLDWQLNRPDHRAWRALMKALGKAPKVKRALTLSAKGLRRLAGSSA